MSQPAPVSTTVSGAPPAAQASPAASNPNPGPAASQPAGGGAAEDVAAIKARVAELEGQVSEHQRNAQFWYEKAQKGPAAEPKEKTPPAEEDVDVLDVITTKGLKGLDELMAKRGYIRKDEAEGMVNSKAAQLTKEAELLKSYPDLADKESEFFKTTAGYYGELKKAGIPEHMAMEMAAERAELALLRSGKRKTPQQQTDDDKAQREKDRLARIKAQGGDRGGRPPEGSEEDDELTDEQKHIASAMGISEEAYKARAKKGVQMRIK